MKVDINSKVLVPIDYSEFCAKSLKYALTMFAADKIEVLHVAHVPMANSPGVIWDQVNEESVREHCIQSFGEFCKENDLPDNLSFKVVFGNPAEQVANIAGDDMIGLVLISSHGRRGIVRWFLGSVAEKVVRLSPCPVLVFKPDEVANERKRALAELETSF